MTLVTKLYTVTGDRKSEAVEEHHFDTDRGGPVARGMRADGYLVLTCRWVTIPVPRGGSLILEYVEGEQ